MLLSPTIRRQARSKDEIAQAMRRVCIIRGIIEGANAAAIVGNVLVSSQMRLQSLLRLFFAKNTTSP